MTLRPITLPGAAIPGISPAMAVEDGRLLFLSGHVPLGADGNVVGTTHADQLEQVFANLGATLRAGGSDFASLARLTIYVRDYEPGLLPSIRVVRDRWTDPVCPPASTLIGVAALFDPAVLVEVDGIAAIRP